MLQSVGIPKVVLVPPIGLAPEPDPQPWLAVYVKHRHEKSVAFTLQRRSYECFLPLYTKVGRDNKKFELPLFPGYVFCRSESKQVLGIISTPGVFSVVSFGSTPALIPAREIDAIKHLLSSGLGPQPWQYIAPGQQVRVKDGPLRGVEGVVVEDNHQKWIVVSVHLLQRSVAVKVHRDHL